MRIKLNASLFLATLIVIVLSSCQGKRPFLMVQACLENERGVMSFKNDMRAIAEAEQMKFTDGSEKTQEELERLNASPGYELIYVGMSRVDGVAMEASNLGLTAFEVAIGFSEGSSPEYAHQFAERVVGAVRSKWRVLVVPNTKGALPMSDCHHSLGPS